MQSTPFGYAYPTVDDPLSSYPSTIQSLAEQVEDRTTPATGVDVVSSVTLLADAASASARVYMVGCLAIVQVDWTSKVTQTFNSTAGAVSDQLICKLDWPVLRPLPPDVYAPGHFAYANATYGVDQDGTVRLRSIGGNGSSQTFNAGTVGLAYLTFPVAPY